MLCLFVALAAVLFSFAPWWAPRLQVLHDRRTFIESGPLLLLAVILAAGLTCAFALPDRLLRSFDSLVRRLVSSALLLPLFLAAALICLCLVNRLVLHSFMNSADEYSCSFLAQCLNLGKLWVKEPPLAEFFKVVHVGNKAGKWFSVYPPGWPLIMSIGLRFHVLDWLNPVMAVFSLGLVYLSGAKLYGRVASWFALAFCLLSPFFTFTSASYYSHTTCLLAMSLFLYAFLRWNENSYERGRTLWAALAGLALGYGLFTRYLTMAAFAAPFVIFVLRSVLQGKRRLGKSELLGILIVLVFMGLILYQNHSVSGKIFKAPNKFDKSWERLGFRGDYTVIDGLVFLLARFFYILDWSTPVLVPIYLAGFFTGWTRKEEGAIQRITSGSFLVIAAAYFFYYSWGGNQYGPRYYYEGFPFLLLAAGNSLRAWWRNGDDTRRKFLAGLLAAALAGSAYANVKQIRFYEEASRQRKSLYELAENTLTRPSIVFVHGFLGKKLVMAEEDATRNDPLLKNRILYAHDLGERNKDLMAAYPDRSFYRGTFDPETARPVLEPLSP